MLLFANFFSTLLFNVRIFPEPRGKNPSFSWNIESEYPRLREQRLCLLSVSESDVDKEIIRDYILTTYKIRLIL